ncbi:hypothetical protein K8352_09170 [Flavobacteriaceae bacterium F89]|uniref:DUF3872 domain-containing protein n=1 Tax=Cerina litoralis TaxID=2874477 RepID=A0AAE3JPM0_9FLAO|nr:hypothetical protein [Cerina litoralis]MCG2460919.1 hypothetical protein [Cerina litoralis]
MKRKLLLTLLFVAGLGISSCDLGDDGESYAYLPLKVVSADLPESFELNKTYRIKVTYRRPDDCTYFEWFEITKPELTTRNVVPVGAELTDNTGCKETNDEVDAYFNFVVIYTDTYHFRFYTGEDENGDAQYLEMDVPVNEKHVPAG